MSGCPKGQKREAVLIRVIPACKRDLEALAKTHGSLGKGVEHLNANFESFKPFFKHIDEARGRKNRKAK